MIKKPKQKYKHEMLAQNTFDCYWMLELLYFKVTNVRQYTYLCEGIQE